VWRPSWTTTPRDLCAVALCALWMLSLSLMPVNLHLSHKNLLLLEKPISFLLSVHEIGSADLLGVYDIVIRSIILQRSTLAKIYRLRQWLWHPRKIWFDFEHCQSWQRTHCHYTTQWGYIVVHLIPNISCIYNLDHAHMELVLKRTKILSAMLSLPPLPRRQQGNR